MKKSILKRVLVTLVLFLSLLLVACTKTDFTNLESVVASSSEKVEAEYTSASWDAFETALQGARDVLENTKSKQEEVDAAITALQTALEGLVRRGDKTQLNALITSTKALNSEAYTANTYSAIADKLASAEAVAANVDALQSEIDAAKAALQTVVDALVLRGDKADLSTLITSASALNESAYTSTTWAELTAKLTAAQEVAANVDAIQSEVDAAKAALQTALDALVLRGDKASLTETINSTKSLNTAKYDETSWAELTAKLTAAQEVAANVDAVQSEINAAKEALQTAIEGLKLSTVWATLETLIKDTKELHEEIYVEEKWNAVETLLTAAVEAFEKEVSTSDEITEATTALKTAFEALEKYPFVYEGSYSNLWRGGKVEVNEEGNYVVVLPFVLWSSVNFTYNGKLISFDNKTITGYCINQAAAPWTRDLYTENGSTFIFSMSEGVNYEFTYNPEAETLHVDIHLESNQFIAKTINADAGADAIALWGEGTKIFDATAKTWVANQWKYYFVFDAEGRICHAVCSPGAGYGGPTGNGFYRNYQYVDKSTNPAFVTVGENVIDIVVPKGGFAISSHGASSTLILSLFTNGEVTYSGSDIAKYNAYSAAFSQGLRVKCNLGAGIFTVTEEFDANIPAVAVDADCGAEAVSVYSAGTKIHTENGWLKAWRNWIVFDKDGKITYAVFAPDNGYGGPTETTYYTHPDYTDYTKNPSIVLLEGFGPWVQGGTAHNKFEIVVPEGGYAVSIHGAKLNDYFIRLLSNNKLGFDSTQLATINSRTALSKSARLAFDAETKTISVSHVVSDYELTVPAKGAKWTEYTQLDTDGIFFATNNVKTESLKINDANYAADGLTFTSQFSLTSGKVQIAEGKIINAIRLVLDKEVKITVYAAQKNDKTTSLKVINAEGQEVTVSNLLIEGVSATEFDQLPKDKVVKYEFTLPAGEYGIGGASGGAYVYGMKVTK